MYWFLKDSVLHTPYMWLLFSLGGRSWLHEYGDPLSSINLHYASENQELNWDYDNSSFTITLLIQKSEREVKLEFVRNVRDADAGDMNYDLTGNSYTS